MPSHLKGLAQTFLDFLFPRCCLACNKLHTYLCQPCLATVPRADNVLFATNSLPDLTKEGLCGVIPGAHYHDSPLLKRAIHLMKYRYIQELALPLSTLLGERLAKFLELNPKPWLLVPIPLHPRKKRERGFNQNELLTSFLALHLSSPCITYHKKKSLLSRTRYTQSQVRLGGEARIANMHHAFAVTSKNDVHEKDIILIDDVVTTGATLKEAAHALKESGARSVWAFVLAQD